MPAPLHDLTVVEIGQYIAAPYAGLLLADMGARVIKVEPPQGDGIRTWGPHPGGESAPYIAYNRGKECVVADLTTPSGRELVEGLLGMCDVVIENNRPGVLQRFGLDLASVRERHPRIVYCSITGYGNDSPYAGRPGFDLVIQGVTGLMSVTGSPGDDVAKVAVPIVDGTAALHATTAILAALSRRASTGLGAGIDISLQASTITWMMLLAAGYFSNGDEPQRIGSAHPFAAPYQAFETLDEPMTIAAGNERQWQRLCDVLELTDLMEDPRFVRNADRAVHQRELIAPLEARLRTRSRDEWIPLLSDAGVPCGPVNTLATALEDPALLQRGMVAHYAHPLAGDVAAIGNPIGWDDYEPEVRRAPLAGEHTERLLEELGLLPEPVDPSGGR